MRLSSIVLGTENLEDSVNFYTQVLGLKEIDHRTDDKGRTVGVDLQGRDVNCCLTLTPDLPDGESFICFTVDNLDSIVQKLNKEGVDVEIHDEDEGTWASFQAPDDVLIALEEFEYDMPDEKTEIQINRLTIKTDDVEDSVQIYTQALGLKEIEGWTDEDNDNYDGVGLQAGVIFIELLSTGQFESEGFCSISFQVDNLYNTIQKIEAAGVDVYLGDTDEQG